MEPPLQLQTVHGRRAQPANIGTGMVFVVVIVAVSTATPVVAKVIIELVILVILGASTALRLRFGGLFLEDGHVVSRRILFDRSKRSGPALASLSVRPWRGAHQVITKGDVPNGVPCMLRFGAMVPRWIAAVPNELLIREAPVRGRRGGSWQPTGIVWSEDDTFLRELAAYIDTTLGTDPAAAPASAARALHEARYPEFRTSHSFAQGPARALSLIAYACVLFGLAWIIYGVASGAVRDGNLLPVTGGLVPVGIGLALLHYYRVMPKVARTELGSATPEFAGLPPEGALFSGVLVKHGRLVTPGTFVTPANLTVAAHRSGSCVAAMTTRGRSHVLPMLANDATLGVPNELLVRFPKAPGSSAAQWQGTGIFWGDDGAAVIACLNEALQASRERPDDEPLGAAA